MFKSSNTYLIKLLKSHNTRSNNDKNKVTNGIPHFQELREGAKGGLLVEDHAGMIFCQSATPQFSHMLAHPE